MTFIFPFVCMSGEGLLRTDHRASCLLGNFFITGLDTQLYTALLRYLSSITDLEVCYSSKCLSTFFGVSKLAHTQDIHPTLRSLLCNF